MSSLSLFLFVLIIIVGLHAYQNVHINTELGAIIGNLRSEKASNVYEFVGIRYALAPIGNLRFRPSILNENWENTTYNATSYGPICIQPGTANQYENEDCLFLNIYTTSISSTANLPVFVWIHGGAYIGGSGSDPLYNGYNMVNFADNIVLVTINYRLGSLGFLSSKQLYNEDPINWPSTGGLNGVNDQITALKWIKKYISSFGGNPDEITIFGESAGGYATCTLLISPMVPVNTFKRAIVESGSCTGPWSPKPEDVALIQCDTVLMRNFGTNNITLLRQLDAYKFKNVWCLPTAAVDGLILTELPFLTFKNISINAEEWMIGFNSMDGDIAFSDINVPLTPTEYHQYLTNFIPNNETIVNLLENKYYPLSDYPAYENYPSASIAWSTINGDCCVSCPSLTDMQQTIKQLNINGYVYEFRGGGYPNYANHASELAFVFDHKDYSDNHVKWNQTLSLSMMSAWTNFAKYGVPNISFTNEIDNVNIEWNDFGNTGNVMILDNNIRVINDFSTTFRHNVCEFFYNQVGVETMVRLCCIDNQC